MRFEGIRELQAQAEVVHRMHVLIGIDGAGMDNVLFARTGACVVLLTHGHRDYSMYGMKPSLYVEASRCRLPRSAALPCPRS